MMPRFYAAGKGRFNIMRYSLLLTGLLQRLALAAAVMLLMWAVYFWATAGAAA